MMQIEKNNKSNLKNTDKVPMIVISVDDGAYDSYTNIFPMLKKAGIPATFHIVTEYILNNPHNKYNNRNDNAFQSWCKERGLFRPPMTLEQVREIAADPLCEISAHTSDHTNEWNSICKGREDLLQIFDGDSVNSESTLIGFASPGSLLSRDDFLKMEDALRKQGFVYARTALRIKKVKILRVISRKISRVLHSSYLYAFAYRDTLLDEQDTFALNAVPVMHDIRLNQIKAIVRLAERKQENCILLIHSVMKPGEQLYDDNWSWDINKFKKLIDFLKQEQLDGKIRVVKMKELATVHNEFNMRTGEQEKNQNIV